MSVIVSLMSAAILATLANDLRIALRQHARQRGFALTVVCTLALTVGATTAVFAVVNGVLMRALPFASPERLVWIASVRPDNPRAPFTLPEFLDYRRQTRTLSGLAAYGTWSASVAGDGVTERLNGLRMSANAFDVLGVTPAAGHLLTDVDDRDDAPRVVVISHQVWQRKYGGAADVVGRVARINSEPFVIVGVLPPRFPLPLPDIEIVTPLVPGRDPLRDQRGSVNFLRLFGRLRPDTDALQAQAELTAICRALRQQYPVEYARKESVKTIPLHEVIVGDHRQPLLLLLAAVLVVLATALANLAALALVRASVRRAELSVRVVLGASPRHLVRQLAVEALLLAAIGSGFGCLVAINAIAVATRWAPASMPRLDEVCAGGSGLDVTTALFVVGVTLFVTALLTAAPFATIARTRPGDALRDASRGAIGDRWNQRVRHVMVVAEIAAALVLMLATSTLVRNLWLLRDRHPGFTTDGVFQARLSIPPSYRSRDDVTRFYEALSARLTTAPGVERVGVISIAPLSGLIATVPFFVEGQSRDARDRVMANLRIISPGYLNVVGTRLVRGRAFTEDDRSDTPSVALISAALADRFFAGVATGTGDAADAIGRRLLINDTNAGPRPIAIVGIVDNVRHVALDLPPSLDIYLPLRQIHPDGLAALRNNQFWMIKTASDTAAASFRTTFVATLRALDADAAVSGVTTMTQFVEGWLEARRFNLALFGGFALTAVLLAGLGLYGLVSYGVSQRAPEIGLRLAIGARPRDVLRMILRQAAALGLAGVAAGLTLAIVVQPLVSHLVTDVTDVVIQPAVAAAIALVLVAVVLIAAWLPARRAARIEPTLALRAGR